MIFSSIEVFIVVAPVRLQMNQHRLMIVSCGRKAGEFWFMTVFMTMRTHEFIRNIYLSIKNK